ncbi:ROK family protein [Tranquillimonas alkanivorans]|uniref:Glucokinase n=1 Tax=Tranquillimonas alkanivorans TaxID=441119 RepID=A0A1I5RG33_9RHOB|nr:ROK family protein [Tranquillimonas alkanivorans]SFP57465.1 glucokinase [Tranquillimonas alkanivorans]
MAREPDIFTLVADIGGTNTRCALARGRTILPETVRRYRNADYPGLESVLRAFIAEEDDVDCAGACVAAAGPVHEGRATMTNLDWTIDRDTLIRATRAERVSILNDLQAQGHALDHIAAENLQTVIPGPAPAPGAAKLVIGIGTGFNAAPVYDTGAGRYVPPAEAGHANLPIRTEAELRLCKFVETAHGFPAVEDVLSGRGLERVYRWLGHEAGDPRELSGRAIIAALTEGSDPRAEEAVRVFIRMLGTVAGNLALQTLPFGGVYLIGGMARAISLWYKPFDFDESFREKGRFAGFMSNFAVHVVEDDYAALVGCAAHLAALAEQ